MQNLFLELINNPAFNASHTTRWCLVHQSKTESLSDHITEVSLLSYFLALKVESLGDIIDKGKMLEKVLLHDLDETLTGDIPRVTKYYTEEGLQAMRTIAIDAMEALFHSVDAKDEIIDLWKNCKKGKEGTLITISDMICCSKKVVTEVKLLGNMNFLKVAEEMKANLETLIRTANFSEFTPESVAYLKEVISDAYDVMHQISGENHITLVDYGVINNVFSKDRKCLTENIRD